MQNPSPLLSPLSPFSWKFSFHLLEGLLRAGVLVFGEFMGQSPVRMSKTLGLFMMSLRATEY